MFKKHIRTMENLLDTMYRDYAETNYESYDIHVSYERNTLEVFLYSISEKSSYDKSKRKKYLDVFLGLENEYDNKDIIEAIDYFIEFLGDK